jgi:hypothetical protein
MQDYAHATWKGISGKIFRPTDLGDPNSSLVTNDWFDERIRNVGELGNPPPILQSLRGRRDTLSPFPLIKNRLGNLEHPE